MAAQSGQGRARRGRAGVHRRSGPPLIRRREHRPPPRARRWPLPAPSPSALVGIAGLVLIAVGVVHLSGAGTAVPLEPAPSTAQGGAAGTEGGSAVGSDGEPVAAARTDGESTDGGATDGEPSVAAAESSEHSSGTGTAAPATIIVHVSGAVADPGVVELPGDARVAEAIEAAGGATEEAELSAVNLARPLADGEQIHVPVPGEEPRLPMSGSSGSDSGAGTATGQSPIDLNTASVAELEELPGVGPSIASRIVEHREKNGPFTSVDGLLEVSGIGPATLEEIRGRATV